MTQVGYFNDQKPKDNNEIVVSNNKDAHEQIMAYFDNGKREISLGDDTAKHVRDSEGNRNIPSNKKHPIFKAGQGENKNIDKMRSGNTDVTGNFKSMSNITNLTVEVLNKASNNGTDLSSSTDGNSPREAKSEQNFLDNNFKTVCTFPQINKVQRVERTDFTTGQELLRIKRSSKKVNDTHVKKITDSNFTKTLLEQRRHQKQKGMFSFLHC